MVCMTQDDPPIRHPLRLARWAVSASVGIALLAPATVRAGSDAVLVLPLARALALIERPRGAAPTARSDTTSRFRAIIPKRIHIPDLYRIDCERDVPRFAEPVDNDKMVALQLLPSTSIRPSVSFRFDKESLPLGDSSSRLSVELELPF